MQAPVGAMIQGHGRTVKCRARSERRMRHRRRGEELKQLKGEKGGGPVIWSRMG
jgi:hypothetical protein